MSGDRPSERELLATCIYQARAIVALLNTIEMTPAMLTGEGTEDALLRIMLAQHRSLDLLFTAGQRHDTAFRPSRSGLPWEAAERGSAVLRRAGVRMGAAP